MTANHRPPGPSRRRLSAGEWLERGNQLAAAGAFESAARAYEQALAFAPGYAEAHHNLGNVLGRLGRFEAAVEAYRRGFAAGLVHPFADYNLGRALRQLGRIDEAMAAVDRALEGAPDHAPSHNLRGNCLRAQGRLASAAECYLRALALDPDFTDAHANLAAVLYLLHQGDAAAATRLARDWLAGHPCAAIARHQAAALGAVAEIPERAADDYVRSTFDRFAADFDQRLNALGYRAPALLVERLCADAPHRRPGAVLDAGCGTGLAAPLLRPLAATLSGVDLSPGMLTQARALGLYDHLYEAELTTFLVAHPAGFDLILAADVLCYFGALEPVLAAAAAALKAGGRLGFSLERAGRELETPGQGGTTGYRLGPHGRYSHQAAGVPAALTAAGFSEITIHPAVLRHEAGHPVEGLLVQARR